MLRRVGSRPELAIRRKHGTIGQLRHSGTKFNPRQHHCPREHCHSAGRHNPDFSRFDVTKRDLSECDYPGLEFAQRHAQPCNSGIHHTRVNVARCDRSGLDIAKRHAEYDEPRLHNTEYDATRIYFAKRHAEYYDSGIDFAQRDTEYNDPWIDFATRHGSG